MTGMKKIILHLYCGKYASDSKLYRANGYDVRLIGLFYDKDVRLYVPPKNVYGIIANPPCTHLAGSGARWWEEKGDKALLEALALVDATMRIIMICSPTLAFWYIENPVGRLSRFLGKPDLIYNPCDYGDPYTKKTCLWGDFNKPKKKPVKPVKKSPIHYMSPSKDRSELRSICPQGFAQAFYKSNK